MHGAFLSVDLGNSRCKACWSSADAPTPTVWSADCGPGLANDLAAWLGTRRDEGFQVGTGGIERGGVAGRARTHDEYAMVGHV